VRPELEELLKNFPDRFRLHYTLDKPPAKWQFSTGFISRDMIERYCLFDGASKNTQVFMCGPPPMLKFACVPALNELGFNDKEFVLF
jgi:cytochrome-b5 reductase